MPPERIEISQKSVKPCSMRGCTGEAEQRGLFCPEHRPKGVVPVCERKGQNERVLRRCGTFDPRLTEFARKSASKNKR